MTTTDILNTEVEDLWPLARQGFSWWIGELADLVPARWRLSGASRPGLFAELGADGSWLFSREGRPATAPAGTAKVTLLLAPGQVLMRSVALPPASDRDTRRLLALDVDRVTPFSPETVFTAIALEEPGADGRRRARLAVAPRGPVLETLERARASGLDPRAVLPREADGLDFMPAIRQALGPAERDLRRIWPWMGVGLLLIANLAVAIGRDMNDLAHRRAELERDRPVFDRALRIRSEVLAEARRRAANARARANGEPLRVLAAVTEATPSGAWVQRFAWNGQAVRLAGFETEATDIGGALRRTPMFRHVRNTLTEASAKATAGQAFDVTADVVPAETGTAP